MDKLYFIYGNNEINKKYFIKYLEENNIKYIEKDINNLENDLKTFIHMKIVNFSSYIHDYLKKKDNNIILNKTDEIYYYYLNNFNDIIIKENDQIINTFINNNYLLSNINSGFFSCTEKKLEYIIDYFIKNKKIPLFIDCKKQYMNYKINKFDEDISPLFFSCDDNIDISIDNNKINNEIKLSYNSNVPRIQDIQFSDYKYINFKEVLPFIKKYFNPSTYVLEKQEYLVNKYNINYDNICSIMYRGNDKITETNQPSYSDFITKAKKIKENYPSIRFLIQTDEGELVETFLKEFSDSIHFEEIPKIRKNIGGNLMYILKGQHKIESTLYYVAALYIMAKTKFIITTSGNGELFMILFRGNGNNVYQYLNHIKHTGEGKISPAYDPIKTYFFLN